MSATGTPSDPSPACLATSSMAPPSGIEVALLDLRLEHP